MAATLWSGTNATNNVSNAVNSVSFQPNFVWIKSRNDTQYHILYDSIRGAGTTSSLLLPLTDGEGVQGALYGYLSAFASNGLTLTPGSISSVWVNATGTNYVGWQWKAGGTAVSNTAGSITSSVSANTTAGFSVVTYTGTGANATVGHGLGVAPAMIIAKKRNNPSNWMVYNSGISNMSAGYITLNFDNAFALASTVWNSTAPAASVFSLGSDSNINGSGLTNVAYCWAPVAGYSAFGSYAGNSSADGPFIYTGFRPRFVMIKCSSDAVTPWMIWDSSRDTYNPEAARLVPNTSDAEVSASIGDFVSNGIKIRQTGTSYNATGSTYIYAAFAENPLKYANAR